MALRRVLPGALAVMLVPACSGVIGDPPFLEPDGSPPPVVEPDARIEPDAAPAELVPSNIPVSILDLGTAPIIIRSDDGEVEIDTDAGTIIRDSDGESLLPTGAIFSKLNQPDAPELGVFSASGLIIERDALVVVRGSAALVFAIDGAAVINGRLAATGGLYAPEQPGPGGFAGGNQDTLVGQGPGGGKHGGIDDAGGGGGGYYAEGGSGGDWGASEGGDGGESYGASNLVPLMGGSGGGFGGGGNDYDALGGGGGGAVQISARTGITIGAYGGINCGGGGGQGGVLDDGGGGGGAGGAILLEAPDVYVAGVLAANGGGGGAGANVSARGASGQTGDFGDSPSIGGAALGEGLGGGTGGGGNDAEGEGGTDTAGVDGNDNGGGGGGGGGRIYIRANARARVTGTVSPLPGFAEGSL